MRGTCSTARPGAVVHVLGHAEGLEHHPSGLGIDLADLLEQIPHPDPCPLGDTRPALHAGVHGDLGLAGDRLELIEGEGRRRRDHATYFEAEVGEVVRRQLLVLRGLLTARGCGC